ncbi:MAG TPA: NAD(P)-dependent oxidoreductase [Nocardioidaceae bacterium]|nr:NAD(P)-dependent oxidoreductase [Nocardioidaceae bacterium]
MKIAVVGATGVVGASTVAALVAAGHDVFAMARTPEKAALLESRGANAVPADLFDHQSLVTMFEGCDVVVNTASRVPVGYRAVLASSWRENDRLRTEGVRNVAAAARDAHVRRLVQESVSLVYADQGDDWIDERSPLDINAATEPACVSESHVQDYQSDLRQGVVLRLGTIVGDDPMTRFMLRVARRGRAIGLGSPEGWVHPLHSDDIGSAVVAALEAPSGVYNVGAEPVRRADLLQGFADAAGRESAAFLGPVLKRLSGRRAEPATRSLRVSSEHFRATTGWTPRRAQFDASWLEAAEMTARVYR